jgi:hypothetical protein
MDHHTLPDRTPAPAPAVLNPGGNLGMHPAESGFCHVLEAGTIEY